MGHTPVHFDRGGYGGPGGGAAEGLSHPLRFLKSFSIPLKGKKF